MKPIGTVSLLVIGTLTALAGPALAGNVALFNPSFETAPAGGALSLGGLGAQGDVPGWGAFGTLPSEAAPTTAVLPLNNPFASGIPDGVQVLEAYQNGGADQNSSTVFAANNTYTYSVWVGLPVGGTPLPWVLLIYGNGNSQVTFTAGDPAQLVPGGWVLSSVSFAPGPGDPHLGQTFYLQFGVGNAQGATQFDHLFFDNVSAVEIPFGGTSSPEPATLFPAGLAALVMFRAWRRRRSR